MSWVFPNNKRVKVRGNFSSINGFDLIPAALAGIGLVWFPDTMVTSLITSGELVKIEFDDVTQVNNSPLYIYYKPVVNDLVRLFITYLKEKWQ